MSNVFFSSDTHFGHGNIIKYCDRKPFYHIEQDEDGNDIIIPHTREHDNALIENWNSVIGHEDKVYHLGDFGFCSVGYALNILSRLNGKIHILRGNHDKLLRKKEVADQFVWIKDYYELPVTDLEMDHKHKIVLCHYAFEVWNKKHFGAWHLHGHSHGALHSSDSQARYDVGVDNNNYFPVSYEQIKTIMTRKVNQ